MADQTLQQTSNASRTGKGGADTQQNLREQVVTTGREVKEKATDVAEASAEKLKEQASEFADAAKDVASQATDRLKETISEQKGAGADYIGNLAATIRRAASEFDDDLPIAGKYIRTAAAQVEDVSESLRTGEFKDLISNAQAFARRQPTAFLGLAALAGFAAVRFLKSSPQNSSHTGGQHQRSRSEYRG